MSDYDDREDSDEPEAVKPEPVVEKKVVEKKAAPSKKAAKAAPPQKQGGQGGKAATQAAGKNRTQSANERDLQK